MLPPVAGQVASRPRQADPPTAGGRGLRQAAGAAGAGVRGGIRAAVVVQRPLPYLYLAASVCADRGVPLAVHDGLPLATAPFAAAVDLVLAGVREDFAREPLLALLRSPQLDLAGAEDPYGAAAEALDRELAARRFTGGAEALRELDRQWTAEPPPAGTRAAAARPALAAAVRAADELAPLGAPGPPADGLAVLLAFLERHAPPAELGAPAPPDGSAPQAREVILAGLAALRDAAAALPDAEPDTDAAGLADLVRQWLEGRPGPDARRPRELQRGRWPRLDSQPRRGRQ